VAAPHGEAQSYGVCFIFKSMEQRRTFRISLPKYPAKDPHYRIVAYQRSRFTHYYFYVRDEVLGPWLCGWLPSSPSRLETAYAISIAERPHKFCSRSQPGGTVLIQTANVVEEATARR